jgi:hypothetical protein
MTEHYDPGVRYLVCSTPEAVAEVTRLLAEEPERQLVVGYLDVAPSRICVYQDTDALGLREVRNILERLAAETPLVIFDDRGDDRTRAGIAGLYD